jgi:hypothetical protein
MPESIGFTATVTTDGRPDVRATRIAEMVELLEAGHKQRPRD